MIKYIKEDLEENMEEFKIVSFLKSAVKQGVSDVHLRVDEHPLVRKDGKIIRISNVEKLTEYDVQSALNELLPIILRNRADQVFDLDFAYEIKDVSRFRINMSRQLGKLALVIRTISYKIPKVKELGLPKSIEQFSALNNGIVLVDYTNLLRKRGVPLMEACIQSAKSRLRPILMTTLTTVLALVPMGFFPGEGSEMTQPIGLTVFGGLTFGTLMTLFLIPTIYYCFNRVREKKSEKKALKLAKKQENYTSKNTEGEQQ